MAYGGQAHEEVELIDKEFTTGMDRDNLMWVISDERLTARHHFQANCRTNGLADDK
jgi:hypothetical protein